MTMTPMVFTARMMKQKDPKARMCFIGPCAAKKLEAFPAAPSAPMWTSCSPLKSWPVSSRARMWTPACWKWTRPKFLHAEQDLIQQAGRGFAQSGGVDKAVADKIKEWHPDMDVKIASAQGLAECKKLLMLAKAGKYNGYLLEGMGCPGGCIGGAGTIADPHAPLSH